MSTMIKLSFEFWFQLLRFSTINQVEAQKKAAKRKCSDLLSDREFVNFKKQKITLEVAPHEENCQFQQEKGALLKLLEAQINELKTRTNFFNNFDPHCQQKQGCCFLSNL